mmetsp:Transcript_5300/g.14248  ORF Transcript_5300/g.14248 Transcript_5300/m.14248 type:complete len:204 (-) Transcript_5300:386-997(-)
MLQKELASLADVVDHDPHRPSRLGSGPERGAKCAECRVAVRSPPSHLHPLVQQRGPRPSPAQPAHAQTVTRAGPSTERPQQGLVGRHPELILERDDGRRDVLHLGVVARLGRGALAQRRRRRLEGVGVVRISGLREADAAPEGGFLRLAEAGDVVVVVDRLRNRLLRDQLLLLKLGGEVVVGAVVGRRGGVSGLLHHGQLHRL